MGEDSGGGKSTQVQAPQRSAVPINTGTRGGGFVRASKKKLAMTAGDFQLKAPKPAVKTSWAEVPKNPYPKLTRNDKCGCGSGKKYKHCCLG